MDRFGAEINFKSVSCDTYNPKILVNNLFCYKYCKLQNLHWIYQNLINMNSITH